MPPADAARPAARPEPAAAAARGEELRQRLAKEDVILQGVEASLLVEAGIEDAPRRRRLAEHILARLRLLGENAMVIASSKMLSHKDLLLEALRQATADEALAAQSAARAAAPAGETTALSEAL